MAMNIELVQAARSDPLGDEQRLAERTRAGLGVLAGLNLGLLGLAALLEAAWPTELLAAPPSTTLQGLGALTLVGRGHFERPGEQTAAGILLLGSAAIPAGVGVALDLWWPFSLSLMALVAGSATVLPLLRR
jgi:hypothetical protein